MSAPAVAVYRDSKRFAAAWSDKRKGNDIPRVFWSLSKEPQFSSDQPIHPDGKGQQDHPSLAFDSVGTLWAAWEESQGNREHIWIRSSDKTLPPRQLSSADEGKAYQPVIAVNGGVVVVVYETMKNRNKAVVCQVLVR